MGERLTGAQLQRWVRKWGIYGSHTPRCPECGEGVKVAYLRGNTHEYWCWGRHGWKHELPEGDEFWQNEDHTYTPLERALDVIIDGQPTRREAA